MIRKHFIDKIFKTSLNSFLYTQLNDFKYFFLIMMILLTINPLFPDTEVETSISMYH